MNYTCPVCGYDSLELPPINFEICPSCGTEFGLDDIENSLIDLTLRWIRNGMHWWSNAAEPPRNWRPEEQVAKVLPNLLAHYTQASSFSRVGQMPIITPPLDNNDLVTGRIFRESFVVPESIASAKHAFAST
jgi:hypothetical protein